ncbi:hypothetical protein LTR75_012938 [Friedmanniomyces endolithicus]|nr:hypothetical protein LTR75_012938 [Friedmanniomyces endolithicus]
MSSVDDAAPLPHTTSASPQATSRSSPATAPTSAKSGREERVLASGPNRMRRNQHSTRSGMKIDLSLAISSNSEASLSGVRTPSHIDDYAPKSLFFCKSPPESLTPPCPQRRAARRTMPVPDWQALRSQAFQVLHFGTHHGERSARLQIRERQKINGRSKACSKRWDDDHHRQRHGEAGFGTSRTDLVLELDGTSKRARDDLAHNVDSTVTERIRVFTVPPEYGTQGSPTPTSPSDALISRGLDNAGRMMCTRRPCDDPHGRCFDYTVASTDDIHVVTVDDVYDEGACVAESDEAQKSMELEVLSPSAPWGVHKGGVECSFDLPKQGPETDGALFFAPNPLNSDPAATATVANTYLGQINNSS